MLRVILLRPGATEFDEQRRIKGTLDIPLNAAGRAQIQRIAQQLAEQGVGDQIDAVYVAPGQAAEETAAVLIGSLEPRTRVKSKTVRKLRNLDQGLWQGKLIEEVKTTQRKVYRRWQEEPESVCPPEGETVESARQRVSGALEKIVKRHKTGVVVLVAPEPIASIVGAELSGGELGDLWRAETSTGRFELIDMNPRSSGAPS